MKNNRMNRYIIWGLLINIIIMSLKQFIKIPDAIYCFCMGAGIALEIFGIYSIKHDTTKIKSFKINLIRKLAKSR